MQGSQNQTSLYMRNSLLLANQWYLYGNGNVTIKADNEINLQNESANLVLFGSPGSLHFWKDLLQVTNSVVELLQSNLPVSFSENPNSFSIGPRVITDYDAGIQFYAPISASSNALILAGNSIIGDELAFRCLPVFSGFVSFVWSSNFSRMTLPDYYAMRSDTLWQGDGGVIAAGYWGNHWEYLPSSSYIRWIVFNFKLKKKKPFVQRE